MANLRSFTGFLALDVLGTQNAVAGLSFAFPGADPLDIIIQDGDALLQGDSGADDQSADPQGDQIGFVTNSDGEALLDGQEIYVETSFTFTLDGAGSFTGYILENEGSGQSFVVLPPNLAAGTIEITAIDDTATDIDYALLGSGDEEINQNDFSDLDLSGADTINAGGGNDTIDAGEGDDSISAGDGDDTVFGNAGGDTVDGGVGNDSIRGDSGEDGIAAVRESFNWADLGLNSGDTIPNNANGIDQDTGNITVNIDYTELARFTDVEYRNNFAQFTDGIDTGGEVIGDDIGFFVGDGTSPPGDTVEFDINFSANAAGFEDEVRNVQFRINDLDDLNWRDIVEIRAFDANGDAVHVVLTGGSNITLTDTDGVNGFDTALANDTNSNNNPIDASNSLLVEVPGPVARINFVYGNQETAGQRIDVTDIFFDAVPTAIANAETGDDSLLGGAGDDTIFGEAGEDTIDGGTDDDSVEGGAGDDLLQLTDNFGNDTIIGGEIGETTGDTLDGGALTEAVNVVYSGDEAGDALNNVSGDSAAFSEIEHINTGSGDDTIDGTLDTVGIDLNAGAGSDTILGGQAGDTLNAGSGADTIDGQAGDDTINAGDDADEIRLTDGFDNDSIIGGEGGVDFDIVTGATLTEDVVVTYDGDESGNFVGQTSGDDAAFDEIEGVTTGSGDDTVNASADSAGQIITTNAGTDTVLGGAGGDTIDAGADDDTVDGGAGADSIAGGEGDDSLFGGAGDDTIVGGDGNDTIDGGEDDDFLTGGDEDDLFIYMAGQGDDTISDFNFGNTGALGDGDPTNNDFLDLTDFYTNLTEARADIADDGVLNQSVGDFTDNTLLDGSLTLAGVVPGGLTTDNTGLANEAGDFPHIVQGADGGAGLNQDGDNIFDDGRFYVEFIDNTGPTANLADLGFDTLDGSLGTAPVYNAGTTDNLDIAAQTGTFGNDGEEYGARVTTTLDVASGGTYTFTTTSDDGSILFINGTQVVNNDGLHATQTRSGTIDLDPGQYEITVLFFENGGADNLSATISGPDTGNVALSLNDPAVSIRANAGAETVLGGAGDDTFQAGVGDDMLFGDEDQDLFVMTNGFDSDTITGGEGGTDRDSIDGSALSSGVNVVYSGDEAGTFSDPFDTAVFSEIENLTLTAQDDTLDATNDTVGVNVLAGAGDDSLLGGTGGDTIAGEAGQDTLAGEAGADSLTGGDDQDTFILNDQFGDDTIVGGEGGVDSDTLEGGALTENVSVIFDGDEQGNITNPGGDNADFSEIEAIRTGSGQDTIDASADTAGADIDAGDGDDVIIGGAGDDVIDAGGDDDTITFGQNDTVLGGAGADEFIVQPTTGGMAVIGDFDPSTNVDNTIIYDSANPPDQTDNDFVDLSGFFANINELRDANTPNGNGDVVLDLGDGQTLTFVGVSDVTLLNFENTNVICFARGAKIRTAKGDVAVEDLVAGDLIETMDSGAQPIRWIGRRIISAGMLDATPRLRPVRITKGALGASRDLMVSPQHRMLLTGDRAEMMYGTDQVLAAAKDLIDGDMIHLGPADDVEYFHILFDDHEIIFAENVPTESFHPGEQALNTTTAKMQAEIFELFPELAEDCVNRPTARMVLKSHEAKAFVR